MSGAITIVCERTGRWAVALRRGGLPTGGRLIETRTMERHESLLREAGAIHAVFSPRRLHTTNAMLDRQTVRQSPAAESFGEIAWSRLPWGE
jgi:hypothetical protein